MTYAVDWALDANYLSLIHPPIGTCSLSQAPPPQTNTRYFHPPVVVTTGTQALPMHHSHTTNTTFICPARESPITEGGFWVQIDYPYSANTVGFPYLFLVTSSVTVLGIYHFYWQTDGQLVHCPFHDLIRFGTRLVCRFFFSTLNLCLYNIIHTYHLWFCFSCDLRRMYLLSIKYIIFTLKRKACVFLDKGMRGSLHVK